jgi:hypothetical protein
VRPSPILIHQEPSLIHRNQPIPFRKDVKSSLNKVLPQEVKNRLIIHDQYLFVVFAKGVSSLLVLLFPCHF